MMIKFYMKIKLNQIREKNWKQKNNQKKIKSKINKIVINRKMTKLDS